MNEIPLDLNLLREINLDDYSITHTKRRFNRIGGQYFEVKPTDIDYDYAMSGEVILQFKDGVHRLDNITIIYSRVMSGFVSCEGWNISEGIVECPASPTAGLPG